MTQIFGATGEFADPAAARAAVARLVRAGFRRSDIDSWPRGGAYLVHVRTGEDDHPDALRALRERGAGFPANLAAIEVGRLLPLGLAALAGFALYGLARRR